MADLQNRLEGHLAEWGLVERPGTALIAVSGGPDSMALLDLFVRLASRFQLNLVVGHVDHGIASESGEIAHRVMALADEYQVPGLIRSLSLGAVASETIARRERYRALRAMQRESGASYLVTAHHADDQIETVLFRFLRGSGSAGLAGIPARGPGGLIRPLLPFRRAELHDWLGDRLPVFEDPANRNPRHDRSWLRHELLPILRKRFPRLDPNLLAGQRQAARDRSAWSALLRQLPDIDFRLEPGVADVARSPMRTYDKALAEAILRAVAREVGCVLGTLRSSDLVAFVRTGTSGRTLELGSGWIAELVFDRVSIRKAREGDLPTQVPLESSQPGSVEWGPWVVSWRPEPAGNSTRGGLTAWFAGDSEIRLVQAGDRLVPLGGVGHRSAHRLLMEARVPKSERSTYPVVSSGPDLLWIPGVCRSARGIPQPGEISLRVDARHA